MRSGESIVGIDSRLTSFVAVECLKKSPNQRVIDLIQQSSLAKVYESKPFGIIDIVKLGFFTDVSPFLMKYQSAEEAKAPEVGFLYGSIVSPAVPNRFDKLASAKGIRPPQGPFVLQEVSLNGSSPKAKLKDSLGQSWVAKWGDEIHSDVAGSHIFAELGFDVDHPYFVGGKATRIYLPEGYTVEQMVSSLHKRFKVNLSPMISGSGNGWVEFHKMALEARPESVVRLGGLPFHQPETMQNPVMASVMLAHQFIGNWDVKSDNTMLSLVEIEGKQVLSGAFNDLGASFGVRINKFPRDMKFGLPNFFSGDFIDGHQDEFKFHTAVNELNSTLLQKKPGSVRHMAQLIVGLDADFLQRVLKRSGWPKPIADYYFYRLQQRQAEVARVILGQSFKMTSQSPEKLWPKLFEDQKLKIDFDRKTNPESFLSFKGRFRNYGW